MSGSLSLKLWRIEKAKDVTRGVLVVAPDIRPLITLEEPWRSNAQRVSCIPEGKYKLEYTYSPGLNKMTYEIKNVPNRTGIRIHSGNTTNDIEGCILLGLVWGTLNKMPAVLQSRDAIDAFEHYCGQFGKITIDILGNGH